MRGGEAQFFEDVDVDGVVAADDEHGLSGFRAVVILAVGVGRGGGIMLRKVRGGFLRARITAVQHIVLRGYEIVPQQFLPVYRARVHEIGAVVASGVSYQPHRRGMFVLHRADERFVEFADIVDIFFRDDVRAYLHALETRVGHIGRDKIALGELSFGGGHLHRLVDIDFDSRAGYRDGHTGDDVLLHIVHIQRKTVGQTEHERDTDYAYAPRKSREESAGFLGDEVARAEGNCGEQRHRRPLFLLFGLTAAFLDLLGMFGRDDSDEFLAFPRFFFVFGAFRV